MLILLQIYSLFHIMISLIPFPFKLGKNCEWHFLNSEVFFFFLFSFIFISWRLTTSQHFSGFCHTLTWISHGVTCIPHPNPPSHHPLHQIPLGLPSAPGLSTCLMHPTWASTSISWSGFIQISFKDNNVFSLKERLYYELELKGFPWCSSG